MYTRSVFPAVLFLLLRHVVAFTPLTANTLQSPLLRPTDGDFNIDTGSILSPILIPRVPGTEGSLKVLNHLQGFFRTHLPDWQLSTQNSTSETPTSGGKKIPFVNFMATRDPPWATTGETGRLLLVAHYDSKLTPEGFIGATDSAVPVAVMLHTAQAIDAALTKKWEAMAASKDPLELEEEQGIMLLFLDGEEAFLSWTDSDSLYGARSLAEEWESTFHPAMSARRNALSDIQLFVLLDLLGAQDPKLHSFFPTTHWAYKQFSETEARLRTSGAFRSKGDMWFYEGQKDSDPNARWSGGGVQDDHIPFLMRGVEILHLIPTPFPRVWHTPDDDGPHLHMDTCMDWGTLVAAWTAEYMELEGYLGDGQVQKREIRTEL